jgi:hypothetical protein
MTPQSSRASSTSKEEHECKRPDNPAKCHACRQYATTEMSLRTDPQPYEEGEDKHRYEIIPEHDTAQQELNQIDQEATKNTMLVNYKKRLHFMLRQEMSSHAGHVCSWEDSGSRP